MPMGKGTYGSTVGRPKKRKKAMGGGYNDMMPRQKKAMGGGDKMNRMAYGDGGLVDFKNPN